MTDTKNIKWHNDTRVKWFLWENAVEEVSESLEKVFSRLHKFIITKVSNEVQSIMTSEEIEKALHARSIVDSITSVAFNFQNEDHVILDCNQAYIEMVWFPREEIIWKKCTDVCCTWNNCIDNCPIEHIKKWSRENFLCDMRWKYYEKKADMVYDNSWNFLWYVEIYQDRTSEALKEIELKRLNEELRKHAIFFNLALKNSNQGIWEWNVQTGEVWWSDTFFTMLWYDPDEVKMSFDMWEQILHPDDRDVIMKSVKEHIEWHTDNFQFTYRLKTKYNKEDWSDNYKWIIASWKITEFDEEWRPLKASWAHMDFMEVANIKNFIMENEEKLNALISSIPDMFITMDTKWNYINVHTWNPIYKHWNRHEWANLNDIFDNDNTKKILDAINDAILNKDSNKVVNVEYFLNESWKIRYYSWSIKAISNNQVAINTKDVTELKELMELNKHLAMHDALTSLPNRRYFNEELDRMISLSKRENRKLAVLYFDLDWFKNINDKLWHHAWDELLMSVAHRIKNITRDSDFFARLWWDEFAMIINNYDSVSDIWNVIQRILDNVNKPYKIDSWNVSVTTSIWVSLYPEDWNNSSELQKKSDIAMYSSKEHGRNTYTFYNKELTNWNWERWIIRKLIYNTLERTIKLLKKAQKYA